MQDLAAAEKIHPSYLSRALWLTLLAPDSRGDSRRQAAADAAARPAIQAHYPVTSDERKLVAAMLAEGQELDSNILLSRRCLAAGQRSGEYNG